MQNGIQSICIIGAGNVAHHLAKSFQDEDIALLGITSKTKIRARDLGTLLQIVVFESIAELPEADLYLICVNDDQISEVVSQIPLSQAIAYTSGSVELTSLPKRENLGVFYPLQTFSVGRAINIRNVPFFIESGTPFFAQDLLDLGWKISSNVQFASSEERKKMHVAAVFVNNFTNHLAYQAQAYLAEQQLDFNQLLPLLEETVEKLKTTTPFDAQTGPARRNDQSTISAHLRLLPEDARAIYAVLTDSILKTYSNK